MTFMTAAGLPDGRVDPVSDREMLAGGLPPACLGRSSGVAEWFRGYVQTYVKRDVRQLLRIAGEGGRGRPARFNAPASAQPAESSPAPRARNLFVPE